MASSLEKSTRKRNLGFLQKAPIDIDSLDYNGYPMSKHRTCWIHVLSYLYDHKIRISKENFNNIKSIAPCLAGNVPRGSRSKRRAKYKSIVSKQMKKLDTREFDLYLESLWSSFSECKRASFACLDSLWFALYMKGVSQGKVLSWIKKKEIFSKKYVFVPIVCCGSLETKTIAPCMLLLDSLEMANPRRLEPHIRKFVLDIYRTEGRSETKEVIRRIPLLVPKVPQQRDDKECASFVLYFINLFFEGAPENFSIEDYPYFMRKDWFSPNCVDRFCERLESFGN